jgi:F0F1-type ATP synthase epsilon subunit
MKNRVEGHPNLYKDNNTGVIVNRESSDRSRYRLAKEQALSNIESQQELSSMRREMDELKSLIKELLNKQVT